MQLLLNSFTGFAQDLTLGYEPKARANNDGAAVWTMIKAKGFTTDGEHNKCTASKIRRLQNILF